MLPPAAAGRSDLAGVELAGDGIEAGMVGAHPVAGDEAACGAGWR